MLLRNEIESIITRRRGYAVYSRATGSHIFTGFSPSSFSFSKRALSGSTRRSGITTTNGISAIAYIPRQP